MKQSFATRFAVLAAVALVAASGATLAQDGPRMHRGAGGDVALAIAALKGQLNLNTSQQQMWDGAVAAIRTARATGRANAERLRAAMGAELAKPAPDLAAVAAVSDDVQAQNLVLRRQVRDTWLAIYATFTPDQKAIVRDALARRMARMERMHERHAGGGLGG